MADRPNADDHPRADPARATNLLGRLRERLLPTMPDFYALLVAQCTVTSEGTAQLVSFLRTGDPAAGLAVRRLEHEGDRRKAANLEILHRAFATPMDREDFYQAVESIDEILNYAKTSVRELEVLDLAPDPHMASLAELIDAGTRALLEGFSRLQHEPETADLQAERARKSERAAEKAYRRALAELFDADTQRRHLGGAAADSAAEHAAAALTLTLEILKRREIYRHLSNAADHVAHAAQVLADIVNKST